MNHLFLDTGMKNSIKLFLEEVSFCFKRSYCCSYSQTTIYVPKFILSPSASCNILERYYGEKIVVELRLEDMLAQIIITVGKITDFTNPVHTTDRFNVTAGYAERFYLRTENYFVGLPVAYKFILGILPHLHSRMLNVITVSPGWVDSLIHSFGTNDDPRGAFTRVLLANI